MIARLLPTLFLPAAVPAHAETARVALREDPNVLDPTLARSYVGGIVSASPYYIASVTIPRPRPGDGEMRPAIPIAPPA